MKDIPTITDFCLLYDIFMGDFVTSDTGIHSYTILSTRKGIFNIYLSTI